MLSISIYFNAYISIYFNDFYLYLLQCFLYLFTAILSKQIFIKAIFITKVINKCTNKQKRKMALYVNNSKGTIRLHIHN